MYIYRERETIVASGGLNSGFGLIIPYDGLIIKKSTVVLFKNKPMFSEFPNLCQQAFKNIVFYSISDICIMRLLGFS